MAIASTGVGSGLDVSGIVAQLMQVERQPLASLDTREASYKAQLSAFGTLKSALSTFQTSLQSLMDPSKFLTFKASSSDTSIAGATAGTGAVAGSYALDVTSVAQSQKLVAAGQASTTALIGGGASTTLTFDFGTISGGAFTAYDSDTGLGGTYAGSTFTSNGSGAKTVTINSGSNTLSGIRDAINSAGIGVTATIINDGGTSPYRLVVSSASTGASNSVKISVSGDASITSLLAHDPSGTQNLQETVTAKNTELTVDGVAIVKSGTSLTDVIQGVTLNVLKLGTSTVSVTQDTSSAKSAVEGFVKAYNDFQKIQKELTAYNAATGVAAALQGESTVRSIQSQVRGILGSALTSSGAYNNLYQIGITVKADGTLVTDATKLQAALTSNPKDVAALFAATGRPTDSLISYAGSTSKTEPGTYAVSVATLGSQGRLEGSQAANLAIVAGVNDTLSVTVNNVSANITLGEKVYTAAELALEVQSKINGASAFSSVGISVSVTQNSGTLTITSARYGSASNVAVAGAGADDLLGAARTPTAGVDVAGNINGVAASGSGQNLIGAIDDDAEGLNLLVSGGLLGARGTVDFSKGFAYQLDALIDKMLDTDGLLSSATDGLNRNIKDIAKRRDQIELRLELLEKRYLKQFSALDTLVANMNQTSSYLTQQLANLPTIGQ